jgi:putative membrane protein
MMWEPEGGLAMMLHGGWGFGGGLLALLVVVLLVVGCVSLYAYLTRTSRNAPPPAPPTPPVDPALQILRERFARGEIAQAEFDERRRALGG